MRREARRGGGGGCFRACGGVKRREGESKGEVCSVETAMWDFSGQILEAGVWTKLQIFQLGMCIVPGRLPTTERGRERKRGRQTEREEEEEEKATEVKKEKIKRGKAVVEKRNDCEGNVWGRRGRERELHERRSRGLASVTVCAHMHHRSDLSDSMDDWHCTQAFLTQQIKIKRETDG